MTLSQQLTTEIARIDAEIEEQKRIIRRNGNNALVFRAAQSEIKALNTRLSILVENLAKDENMLRENTMGSRIA